MKKTKNITVLGRRWFQKLYGNTYHTVTVITDNETLESPVTYGYGDAFLQTAGEMLKNAGYNVDYPLWRQCEAKKIRLTTLVTDVTRRKDL